MSKSINVRVSSMDADLEFSIQSATTGKQLFDQVAKTVGLREVWFFGLQYTDNQGFMTWLRMDKKVQSQDVKKEVPLQFKLRVKFYPEDVSEELIQHITTRLFFLQLKNAILLDEIYCSPESCVLLASFAAQVKYADYSNDFRPSFSTDRILPQRIMDQHTMSRDEWEERVIVWWKEHRGMLREDAMVEYLKVVECLEMYGITYFDIKNKKGTQLWLGVDALGLNIYERQDRLTPKIGFPWSEIRTISYSSRKFVIKSVDKKAPDFTFIAPRLRINKRIVSFCQGNHELYIRRRKDDSIEVQQMKSSAREEKLARKRERENLQREVIARERAEQQELAYEAMLVKLQRDMKIREQDLLEAQDTICRLKDQLKRLNLAKEKLEQREYELEEMMTRLEATKDIQLAERQMMEQEIRLKQEEVRRIYLEVQAKDEETRRLQEEVDEAKRRQEEVEAAMATANAAAANNHVDVDDDDEEEPLRTDAEKEERLRQHLQMLKEQLFETRDDSKLTEMDKQYEDNLRLGRDKYKTLRDIRKGNTKRRVDLFENM